MKKMILALCIFSLCACVKKEETPPDSGPLASEDMGALAPSAKECEALTDAQSCAKAGCPIFASVEKTISRKDSTCEAPENTTICWTTKSGEALEEGAISWYRREDEKGDVTILKTNTGYSELLGWQTCTTASCPCVDLENQEGN